MCRLHNSAAPFNVSITTVLYSPLPAAISRAFASNSVHSFARSACGTGTLSTPSSVGRKIGALESAPKVLFPTPGGP
jgi:hypothetical protein